MPADSADTSLHRVDVCIVGAGPAGLTAATRLAASGLSLLLLESGDIDFDPSANALNALPPSYSLFTTHSNSRRRQLGGTAHMWNTRLGQSWGARFLRLDDIDFEVRDWMPNSGWPFGLAELVPYYDQAEALCDVSHKHDVEEAEGARFGCGEVPVRTHVERFVLDGVFTRQLPSRLAAASGTVVVTQATVTELLTDPSGVRIEGVRFERPGRPAVTVEASVVVLAAGGIENARLLLLSRAVHKHGLGNGYDLVGRYFMDHHRFDWGIIVPSRPDLFESAGIFDLLRGRDGFRMGKLTIAPETLRSYRLFNSTLELTPRFSAEHFRVVSLMRSLLSRNGARKLGTLTDLMRNWRLAGDVAEAGLRLAWYQRRFPGRIDEGMWSRLPRKRVRFGTFKLVQLVEQSPSPDNRVLLNDRRDRLGQLQVTVECSLQPADVESIHRTRSLLIDHFAQRHIGLVVANEGMPLVKTGGIHHHIGTTRMHLNPRKGVTNAHGEVHDVHNLFVVGSSVFPTAGYANPTLTIVALAIRTADHIAHRLARGYTLNVGVR